MCGLLWANSGNRGDTYGRLDVLESERTGLVFTISKPKTARGGVSDGRWFE